MKGCDKCRDLIVEALYGELDPREKEFFEDHVASCPGCAAEFKALAQTQHILDSRVRPDPGQGFWDGYWERLARRKEAESAAEESPRAWAKALGRVWNRSPRWVYQAAAAAVLVVVGVFIGRLAFSPGRAPVDSAQRAESVSSTRPAANDPVLRAQNYVDRSKLVLLALVNYNASAEDPYALDLPYQKKVSQELVSQAGQLKSDLSDPGQRRLRELVADLETVLLQIANLESENDLEAVEFVKQGVENRGLLLKINLSEMGGDLSKGRPESAPAKSPSQKTSV